jgi:hypothetical protein
MTTIRVGELVSQLRERSRTITAPLRDVELIAEGDGAGILRVDGESFPWGGRNTQVVAAFIKGPAYKYLLGESLAWQRKVVNHHVTQHADTMATWYIEGSSIAGIYYPDAKILPLVSVAERIANVFDPGDMADVLFSPDQVEVNVISDLRSITVPGISGVADRPLEGTVDHPRKMKVGDLSAGGIRIIMQPGKPDRAPFVEELWWRCFCDNQMTRRVPGSQIRLRGRTVPEILDEMENVARVVFEGLESSGQAILHSAQTPVPGAVSDFMRVVARERGITAATVLRLQEQAASLPANPSVYDVTQIITAMANQEGLPATTRRNLQALGGDLTVDTERMVHRCNSCERPLAA